MAGKSEREIKAIVAHEIASASEFYASDIEDDRARAIDYYFGTMSDTSPQPNRSSVTSRDTSDVIGWMLPGIIRTFTASGRIVDYEPETRDDEAYADQASDYINLVFMRRNNGYRILYDSIHDALLQKNGYIKAWWDKTPDEKISRHEGLSEDQLAMLLNDDDVEVLAQDQREEPLSPEELAMLAQQSVDPETGEPMPVPEARTVYDLKIKRRMNDGKICVESIAPEDLLIQKDAIFLDRARFVAQRREVTKSDLLEMGYDRNKVEKIPGGQHEDFSEESLAREQERDITDDAYDDSTSIVDLYECYVRMDVDGDGVAELLKVDYAGYSGIGEILEWEEWEDDIPFFDIPCEPVPHRMDGLSMADYTMDMQKVKTVLQRQMLDNVYAHNNPQPVVREGVVINRDALVNPKFGQPIFIRRTSPDKPLEWRDIPFVADKALLAIQHVDDVIERRTGVSRSSMALDPETLSNQSATAAQIQKDAQYSKVELISRNIAELGLKPLFRGLLKLSVRYQKRSEWIRLRDDWVEMSPQHWNSDMDCTVNVGLGTGSRDRDMAMLNVMNEKQIGVANMLAQYGIKEKALEFLPHIREVAVKSAEAAGIRNADQYYPEFTPQDMQAIAQQMAEQEAQPDPKIELEREKMRIQQEARMQDAQLDQWKAQQDAQLQQQQAQLDVMLKREQMSAEIRQDLMQMRAEIQMKREQIGAELQLRWYQMQQELRMKRELGMHQATMNGAAKIASSVKMGGEPG